MIGFKTTIVMTDNVAPSILRPVSAGGQERGGWGGKGGRGEVEGGIVFHSVKALIISALLVLVA